MHNKPRIESTRFGSIIIDGQSFAHDVLIRLDGRVERRQKELSKAIYGTSHIVSLDEARQVYEVGAKRLIVGTGHLGLARLADGASLFLKEQGCSVDTMPTDEAAGAWNRGELGDDAIGLFHVTC